MLVKTRVHPLVTAMSSEVDHWKYHRAFSPGLQEFVEAISLAFYMQHKTIISYDEVVKMVQLEEGGPSELSAEGGDRESGAGGGGTGHGEGSDGTSKEGTSDVKNGTEGACSVDKAADEESSAEKTQDVTAGEGSDPAKMQRLLTPLLFPVGDYLLGIADLTGELMRLATYQLNQGDIDSPVTICKFVSDLHTGFNLLENCMYALRLRDLPQKLRVMRQSLQKIEKTCYTIQLRSTEVPREMLGPAIAKAMAMGRDEGDEGFADFG